MSPHRRNPPPNDVEAEAVRTPSIKNLARIELNAAPLLNSTALSLIALPDGLIVGVYLAVLALLKPLRDRLLAAEVELETNKSKRDGMIEAVCDSMTLVQRLSEGRIVRRAVDRDKGGRLKNAQDAIRELKRRAEGWFGDMAATVNYTALGTFIGTVEVLLLYHGLRNAFPVIHGKADAPLGLIALSFLSVSVGTHFVLDKFGGRIRSLLEKVGGAATLIYIAASAVMLLILGSKAGLAGTEPAFRRLLTSVGAFSIGFAISGSTALALVSVDHCIRRCGEAARRFSDRVSYKMQARELEQVSQRIMALTTEIAQLEAELAREEKLAPARTVSVITNTFAEPMAVAESWLVDHRVRRSDNDEKFIIGDDEFAEAELQQHLEHLKASLSPAHIRQVISENFPN